MMTKATKQGLTFREYAVDADPLGTMHRPLIHPMERLLPSYRRTICQSDPATERISDAALVRWNEMAGYRPQNAARYFQRPHG